MNSKSKNSYLLIGLLLVVGLLAYFSTQQSFIQIQGLQPYTETINWDGNEAKITTAYLGTIEDAPRQDICGTNDGNLRLSNSFSNTQDLTLTSSIENIQKQPCDLTNYIYADIKLSEGTYKLTYSLKVMESDKQPSTAYFKFGSIVKELSGEALTEEKTLSGEETIIISKAKEERLLLTTDIGQKGMAYSSVTLKKVSDMPSNEEIEGETITTTTESNEIIPTSPNNPSVIEDTDYLRYIGWVFVVVLVAVVFVIIGRRKR